MLVVGDNTLEGAVTIGGCADAQVIEAAQDVARSGRPQLLRVELGEEDAFEIGLRVDLFVRERRQWVLARLPTL
jgi:xanthine dehydrogenase accessory factor